ncbi:porin [Photobacterium profundum]|uniref:OmpL_phopr porin-like protein L n=1 Tax=Photobacterium profundum 3TCK TaxID=314280 RepID=Q1Z371_9GAMM|nr:porin [Photobacterium profundum]EAS42918.1 ompL_phopr porin-like protein L precursor [Photobacterium profundum 3TCK]PSV60893.1 porin [Photobacterium profundum]
MNKKLIALAVAAASISSVATAAEVFSDETSSLAIGGRFEARAVLADVEQSNGKTSSEVSDNSRVRINVAGKTDITDTVYGIGFYEGEFTDGDEVNNRHLNAGIGGDFGQVVYGKTDGSLGMLTDFTDIMAYHGNEAGNKLAAADRTGNNLAYVGSFDLNGDNLTVKTNYVFAGSEENEGYSAAAMYAMDMGLAFGAGYGEQEGQALSGDKTGKQAFGAISYTISDFYFSGLYQDARNTNVYGNINVAESTGYEFAAAYTMGKAVFIATYNYLEDTDKNADLRDSIAVDGTYYFNKNFRTYASYKFNMLDQDSSVGITKARTSDEFVLGARYDF